MKNIWTDPRTGQRFYRSRKAGKSVRIPLPDLPHDHPDFIAAWIAARQGDAPLKLDPGSIGSTWRALLASAQAREWSQTYHAKINRHAAAICAKAGAVRARAVRAEHVRADLDSAAVPADRLRAWRAWGAWCLARGIIDTDPAAQVKPPKAAKTDGHPPWTAADVAAFRARWPVGTSPRAMMELIHWTGARVSDAVLIGRQMIDADGVLTFRQAKTKDLAHVPWTCALPDYAAHLAPDRQMMLDAIQPFAGNLCFVPTRAGLPRSSKAVSAMFQKCCTAAGIKVSAHGLRKTRAIALIEAGATPHQCGAWTGHQTLAEITRYARKFDRRKAVMGTVPERPLETPPAQIGNGASK